MNQNTEIGYHFNGRFGNNILQFIAARILNLICNGSLEHPSISKGPNEQPVASICLTDEKWAKWCLDPSSYFNEIKKYSYYLNEYYQRGDVWLKYIDQVKECMKINSVFYPQSNLTFDKIFVAIEMKSDICVVHFRLDDFNFQTNDGTGNIVDPSFYINEINQTNESFTKFLLIVDKCKYEPEQKYIQTIVEKCSNYSQQKGIKREFFVQQGNVLQDWNTIRCAKKVIASNSTFCWTACFFGWCCNEETEIVYPNTNFYPHQYFQIQQPRWRSIDVNRINFLTFDYNSIQSL